MSAVLSKRISPRGPLGMNFRNSIIRKLNSAFSVSLAKDKSRFKNLLEECGITVPHSYYEIREYYELSAIRDFPDAFVLKPNKGLGGNGILILKREDDIFVTPSHEQYSRRDIDSHIRKVLDGEFSGYAEQDLALVEERIYPSPQLLFKGAVGLPDIRVFCYRFRPVMAMFRYSTLKSRGRANLSQGAVGMGIDIESGMITHVHAKEEKGALSPEDFGIPRVFRIPRWGEVKDGAMKAAEASQLTLSGVDITLDAEDRVVVIEINGHPGLEIQNINERSLLECMDLPDKDMKGKADASLQA